MFPSLFFGVPFLMISSSVIGSNSNTNLPLQVKQITLAIGSIMNIFLLHWIVVPQCGHWMHSWPRQFMSSPSSEEWHQSSRSSDHDLMQRKAGLPCADLADHVSCFISLLAEDLCNFEEVSRLHAVPCDSDLQSVRSTEVCQKIFDLRLPIWISRERFDLDDLVYFTASL